MLGRMSALGTVVVLADGGADVVVVVVVDVIPVVLNESIFQYFLSVIDVMTDPPPIYL